MNDELRDLKALATRLRKTAIQMTHRAKSAHVGGSLSMADLLAALYGALLQVDPKNPSWEARDRFILSKGHACAALYAVLAERGFFPSDWLETFYQDGGRLAGHATHTSAPGIEISTGSLGHGLSIGCGMALAAQRDGRTYRTVVMLSDGECDEGSVWEAVLFASHHRLDNLIAVVDFNKIQSLGHVHEVLGLEPFADKWTSFGWSVKEIDGHNMEEIVRTFRELPFEPGKPSCVLAHTIKGKGVSFMENKLLWHYRNPSPEDVEQAMAELDALVP